MKRSGRWHRKLGRGKFNSEKAAVIRTSATTVPRLDGLPGYCVRGHENSRVPGIT